MMAPMHSNPGQEGSLSGHRAQDGQNHANGRRRLESAMREVAVVTHSHAYSSQRPENEEERNIDPSHGLIASKGYCQRCSEYGKYIVDNEVLALQAMKVRAVNCFATAPASGGFKFFLLPVIKRFRDH
ncbi:hypothetical protein D9M68_814720 [compost metagenome]